MPTNAFQIEPEHPDDSVGIDHLHETAFGPGRFVRTAFRLREGVAHDPALSFIAKANGTLVGSVRLTPILIGAAPALLLGPLTVSPDFKNKGAGKALLRRSVEEARAKGIPLFSWLGTSLTMGRSAFAGFRSAVSSCPDPSIRTGFFCAT